MNWSMPGFPVLHHLLEFVQTHVHWVNAAIQPSYPLFPPSSSVFNLSQQQVLFLWVSSSQQMAKILELQLQHQSFQWIMRVDFLRIDGFDLLAVWETIKSLLQKMLRPSILQHSAFFMVQLSHPYTTTGKTIALTPWTCVSKETNPVSQ